MSIGRSGRVVIEIDPLLKRELHAVLAKNGMTMKDWFVKSAMNCIKSGALEMDAEEELSAVVGEIRQGRQYA
ncbi:hypothetical protein GJ697_04105 [Pseudoduganella sp. FT25W]|uniref:Toxin-antitoxin system HicB family antitoxin n=1 Tax=Duganella alba TaxID=2666081 RepID=A0A6L5QB62_9BURK|nr:hypothetical protein [Duganella alba]MRX16089.1 hypothetical protein [Duganella alba]